MEFYDSLSLQCHKKIKPKKFNKSFSHCRQKGNKELHVYTNLWLAISLFPGNVYTNVYKKKELSEDNKVCLMGA